MAVEQKKINDPAEAALSAVEEALAPEGEAQDSSDLDTSVLDTLDTKSVLPSEGGEPPLSDATDALIEDPAAPATVLDGNAEAAPELSARFDTEFAPPAHIRPSLQAGAQPTPMKPRLPDMPTAPAVRKPHVAPKRTIPANDDRKNAGQLAPSLSVRPSRLPYLWATLASALWVSGLGSFAHLQGYVSAEMLQSWSGLTSALGATQFLIGFVSLFTPVFFFFIAAMLAVRSQEMKLVARAVGEVALRLAQPETFSTDAVLSVSQAVRREIAAVGDGVERALARAGELETLVRSEIATLERSYSDNEIRIRSMIDELVTQRESIVTNAERVRLAISGTHQTLAADLEHAADRVVTAMTTAGDKVTDALEQRGEAITVSLGHAGEKVISDMAGRGHELVERLGVASSGIKDDIATVGSAITTALESKAQDLTAAFERTGDMLNQHLQEGASSVTKTLAETGRGVLESLVEQGAEVRAAFEHTARTLESSFAKRGNEIADTLAVTGETVAATISERGQEISDRIATTGADLSNQISSTGADVQNRLESVVHVADDMIGTRVENLATRLESASQRVNDSVTIHGDALEEKLTAVAQNVTATVSERVEELRGNIDARGKDFAEILDRHTNGMFERLTTTGAELVGAVATQGGQVNNTMTQMIALSKDISALVDTVTGRIEDLDRAVSVQGKHLADSLGDRTRIAMEMIKGQLGILEQQATKKSGELSHSFESLLSRVDDILEARSQALNEALISRTGELARVMAEGGREVASALETRVDQVGKTLAYKGDALGQHLASKAEEINRNLGNRAQEISDTLDQTVAHFEERIIAPLGNVASSIDERSRAVASVLGTRIDTLSEIFDSRGGMIINELGQRVSEMGVILEQRAEGVLQSLDKRLADVGTLLSSGSYTFVEELQQRSEALTRQLTHVAEGLLESSTILRSTVDEGAERAVQLLLTTNDKIRGEIAGVIDRVHEANHMLQQVVSNASGNLNSVESNLAGRVEQIENLLTSVATQTARATEKIDEQVDSLRSVATGAMRQASTLATTLDERSQKLTESTHSQLEALSDVMIALERLEERVGNSLNQRQYSMENLLNLINSRTTDIEKLTSAFSSVIEDSLRTAESRTREIGTLITDTAEATTAAINDQFTIVRNATDTESRRTAQSLREAYERATAEMSGSLSETTQGFRQMLNELRGMSAQIKQELESTRSELQRGIVELPKETQETTANMRRVVSDQIKALNELTSLVTKSGRSIDAAPASASTPANNVNALQPLMTTAKPVPASTLTQQPPAEEKPSASLRQAQSASRPLPMPAELPKSLPREQTLAPAFSQTQPVVPLSQKQSEPAQLRQTPPTNRGGSWLSDLLDRASRDETVKDRKPSQRTVASAIETLDSISVDIARLIDHDNAVELWERYRKGEKNIFTRRLYTLQGQQTFDDIRRRYQSDTEFKNAVNRYIEEFERLLTEVGANDRDMMVTKTYLTSETGKVYTMLAHASGRLG